MEIDKELISKTISVLKSAYNFPSIRIWKKGCDDAGEKYSPKLKEYVFALNVFDKLVELYLSDTEEEK